MKVEAANRNEALYRTLIETVVRRDYGRLDDLFTTDAVLHTFDDPTPKGIEAANEVFFTAFPDTTVQIETLISGKDHVAATLRWSGTHTAALGPIAPTGASVRVMEIEIVKIREGRISDLWNVIDLNALYGQLGVRPAAE